MPSQWLALGTYTTQTCDAMSWFDDPVAAALTLPPLVLALFVFASACLEYIFPPYWGDMFVLLGFFLAGQGAVPVFAVFLAALIGSTLGAIIAYQLGRKYGMIVLRRIPLGRRRAAASDKAVQLFQRFGEKLLIVNRFLPVVRAFLLYGAGALELRFRAVMLYCFLSNLAFIGLLMWAGLWTADSWLEIQAGFRHSNQILGVVALVAVAAWVGAFIWRMRRNSVSKASHTID